MSVHKPRQRAGGAYPTPPSTRCLVCAIPARPAARSRLRTRASRGRWRAAGRARRAPLATPGQRPRHGARRPALPSPGVVASWSAKRGHSFFSRLLMRATALSAYVSPSSTPPEALEARVPVCYAVCRSRFHLFFVWAPIQITSPPQLATRSGPGNSDRKSSRLA